VVAAQGRQMRHNSQVVHMLHILPAVKMRENRAQPSRKRLTPGDGSLMPPAIQSGRSTRSRKDPQAVFIALPGLCLAQPLNLTRSREGAKK